MWKNFLCKCIFVLPDNVGLKTNFLKPKVYISKDIISKKKKRKKGKKKKRKFSKGSFDWG